MASKASWRLKFIDIDASFSVNTESSTIKGYMVVRAPKGEVEPYYFEKGNQEAIYAYIGLPTANWPDIYEAEAFNLEYGIYISAPPGSADDYPSYFGGSYITSDGIIDFCNVTSKDTIDYTQKKLITDLGDDCSVKVYVREGLGEDFYKTTADVDGSKETLAFYIGAIDSTKWGGLQEIAVNYWGDDRSNHSATTAYYYINKEDHKLYVEDEDGNAITDYYCGIWGKGTNGYFIILGGGTWLVAQEEENIVNAINSEKNPSAAILTSLGLSTTFSTNTSLNTDAPFFTADGLIANIEEAATVSVAGTKVANWDDIISYLEGTTSTVPECFEAQFIVTEGTTPILYTIGTGTLPNSNFTALMNIKSKTYAVIFQKSACEKATNVTFSSIGYDKWLYDAEMPYIAGKWDDLKTSDVADTLGEYFIAGTASSVGAFVAYQSGKNNLSIYHINTDLTGETLGKQAEIVSADYISKDVLVRNCYLVENGKLVDNNPDCEHGILYVVSEKVMVFEFEDDANYPLRSDINYNTMTFKITEEVYPGSLTSGGEFTGSLDENGKDSYGANIYWPNVLNENDFSFIEIIPVRTFEKELDTHGIYTGKRLVDDIMTTDLAGNAVGTSYKLTLKGQRYVTHIVEKNIAAGTTGGSWRKEFMSIVKQGWNEAYDTNYDDVYVFMDPTGQEEIHTLQASLVEGTHKLAIAISPKIISKAEFNNPSSIVVTARNKQCAQYAGEFKVYDSYTGKNYWCMPIGDVGRMCARIFDKKMGGWAPAWYNYNSMGGQLDRAVLEARWRFSDSATQIMDTKGINPIVYNPDDGLMIVSSKTTQDPNNLTDWSFLEHVMAFVLLKRDIRDNVMRPQIEKPIDDYWMSVRQTQVDAILAKRTEGSNKIWTAATCDIAGVNTDVTKAQRKFKIYVKVKVTVFAQTVELTLENVAQTTQL